MSSLKIQNLKIGKKYRWIPAEPAKNSKNLKAEKAWNETPWIVVNEPMVLALAIDYVSSIEKFELLEILQKCSCHYWIKIKSDKISEGWIYLGGDENFGQ